jgi:phytanoyl-CoA hydroxylase
VSSKGAVFNKLGHALHALNPVFKEATFNSTTKKLFADLGFKKPVVCQSQYIFKQPFIGGEGKAKVWLGNLKLKI